MRTINRKLLSSKLHPIIIRTKKNTDKQSQIAARHKVTDDMNKRPPPPNHLPSAYQTHTPPRAKTTAKQVNNITHGNKQSGSHTVSGTSKAAISKIRGSQG